MPLVLKHCCRFPVRLAPFSVSRSDSRGDHSASICNNGNEKTMHVSHFCFTGNFVRRIVLPVKSLCGIHRSGGHTVLSGRSYVIFTGIVKRAISLSVKTAFDSTTKTAF